MNANGVLTFDVNDFDEAYLGHFSWDLRRFVASLALMGWQKALPEDAVRELAAGYLRAYVERVHVYVEEEDDAAHALQLDTAEGHIHDVLRLARSRTRIALLDGLTELDGDERRFRRSGRARELDDDERGRVLDAFAAYLETIPPDKRERREIFYAVKDVVGTSGFGMLGLLRDGLPASPNQDGGLVVRQSGGSGKANIFQFLPKYQFIATGLLPGAVGIQSCGEHGQPPGLCVAVPSHAGGDGRPGHAPQDGVRPRRSRRRPPSVGDFARPADWQGVRLPPAREGQLGRRLFNALDSATILGRQYDLSVSTANNVQEIMNPRVLRLGVRFNF